MQADACALDADRRELTLDCGTRLNYDLLSLNVGSTLNPPAFEGSAVLPLRPWWRLRIQWEEWCYTLTTLPKLDLRVAAAGDGRAIGQWGPFSAKGAWLMRWKDFIDRRFIRRHSIPHRVSISALQGDRHA